MSDLHCSVKKACAEKRVAYPRRDSGVLFGALARDACAPALTSLWTIVLNACAKLCCELHWGRRGWHIRVAWGRWRTFRKGDSLKIFLLFVSHRLGLLA